MLHKVFLYQAVLVVVNGVFLLRIYDLDRQLLKSNEQKLKLSELSGLG